MRNSAAMRIFTALLATVLSAAGTVQALQVAPGSKCEALCLDGGDARSSKANTSEIACEDRDFFDSGKGIKFRNCVSCLQDSEAVSEVNNDVDAFLYNVRYAFDVCLFSYPDTPEGGFLNTPCNIDGACGQLSDAMQTALLDPTQEKRWNFCDEANDFEDWKSYNGCIQCLQNTQNQKYFSNFLVALKAGCEQRPEDGKVVSINGGLFTTDAVEIVEPEEDIRSKPKGAGSNTLTTGAIVGIAVGCALLFLGASLLLFIYCRRQRREARLKLVSPPPDTPGGPGFISNSRTDPLAPTSHKMSESISSFNPRYDPRGHKRAYSSNAEYYDQLAEDKGLGLNYHFAPTTKSHGPYGALPAHPAYIPRVVSRNSDRSRSPPPSLKNNAPDSYALRTYLSSNEPTVINPNASHQVAGHHARSYSQPIRRPSPPRQAVNPGIPPPPSQAPPSKHKSKVPSLILPSLSKAKKTKMYAPPIIVTGADQSSSVTHGVDISKPLAVAEERFQDRPLGGGQIEASKPPATFEHLKQQQNPDSPMLSGDSRVIYG